MNIYKSILCSVFSCALIVLFSASQAMAVDASSNKSNVLIVYFSLPETNNPNGMTSDQANSTVVIDGKVLGNTQYFANIIQENTSGDIFRIEAEDAYPLEHKLLIARAEKERAENARPQIKGKIENLADYEIVFLGYPNWLGDMPMILYTFLENNDLSDKRVIPFNTHGGSGLSDTVNTIIEKQPKANVETNALSISRNVIHNAKKNIEDWINSLYL